MSSRVLGAFAFGFALLLAAYTFSDFGSPRQITADSSRSVVVAKAPERTYIPTQDSNNDGVPDWQDVLQKTTPLKIESSSEEYIPPTTLTERFAVDFFEDMVRNKQYGSFGNTPEELVKKTSSEIQQQAYDKLFNQDNIVAFTNNSTEAGRAYGNRVAMISQSYALPEGTENEIYILEDAIAKDDVTLLKKLDPIILAYTGMVSDMLATPVPPNLAKEHLDLLNAYNAILQDVRGMRQAFGDPLQTLLRIQRYQEDANGLYLAFTNVFTKAYEQGVRFEANDPALTIIEFR